jgi:glycosyltransferase involved in cell wall biosynthesis
VTIPAGPLLLSALPPANQQGWPWTEETPAGAFADPPPGGWPKISIVCPSFQQGRYIEETIRSVLLQNYPAVEFIVMDGGSSDGTVVILQRYAPWLARWESQPDRGQSHAINKACDHATGEIIGWINSDDYYLPRAFATVARAYRANPRSLIYGDWAQRENEDPALTIHREQPAFAFQIAVGGRTLPSHATFWPRAAHQRVNESLQFIMDADLFKRLAASGLRARHVARPLAVARVHPAAKTSRLIEVARAETAAWSQAQPWHTHWRWRCSQWIDRIRRILSR